MINDRMINDGNDLERELSLDDKARFVTALEAIKQQANAFFRTNNKANKTADTMATIAITPASITFAPLAWVPGDTPLLEQSLKTRNKALLRFDKNGSFIDAVKSLQRGRNIYLLAELPTNWQEYQACHNHSDH